MEIRIQDRLHSTQVVYVCFLRILDKGNIEYFVPSLIDSSKYSEDFLKKHFSVQTIDIPVSFSTLWYSILEKKYYYAEYKIPSLESDTMACGLESDGSLLLWSVSDSYSNLVFVFKGVNVSDSINENAITWFDSARLNSFFAKPKIKDMPIDNKIKRYCYRLFCSLKNNGIDNFIASVFRSDGTHDKLHDGGLMKYHEAGKPKKLALKWHIKKSDYSAYFWFEDEEICAIFNKFYGQHPDTKTDFIIHIDPIKKKYELSLYRYGLKEPVIIPESAYQLIVFKSGFENYRSKNYNQPTGAWIW